MAQITPKQLVLHTISKGRDGRALQGFLYATAAKAMNLPDSMFNPMWAMLVANLDQEGLVVRHASERGGVTETFELTDAGRRWLAENPLPTE